MAVDVEDARRARVTAAFDVMAGERLDELVGASEAGQFLDAPAQRLRLGDPVETEQPSDVDRIEPGEPLGPGLAQQGGEDDAEHERSQVVVGGPGGVVGRGGGIEQPGRRQQAGRTSRAPANGNDAPSVMCGSAPANSPARAAWRSATRGVGRASGSSAGASTTGAAGGGTAAARARKTMFFDTPARRATSAWVSPS